MRSKYLFLLLLVLSLLSMIFAASSTSFCKCTCFNNSTIIQLDGAPSSSSPTTNNLVASSSSDSNSGSGEDGKRSPDKGDGSGSSSKGGNDDDSSKMGHGTCLDCNKKFCLEYNLPICKGATEEDVFTTCFQRDSAKDEAVVFIFIFATVGLLVYAAVKPWLQRSLENLRERRTYAPVSHAAAEES